MSRKPSIFVVTSLDVVPPGTHQDPVFSRLGTTRNSRSWGWFPSLREAERAIKNDPLVWVQSRGYCVVEKVGPGIFGRVRYERWYKPEFGPEEKHGYPVVKRLVRIEKPQAIRHIVHFGLG